MLCALDKVSGLQFDGDQPRTLKLSETAASSMDDWYRCDHGARQSISGKVGSAYGKLPGLAARLAGNLHVIDWAFSDDDQELSTEINEQTLAAALVLVEDYFVPQIGRAYQGANASPEDTLALALLKEAHQRRLKMMNLRDARRTWNIPGARKSGAVEMFKAAAQVLVEDGWARPSRTQGGSSNFELNPAILEDSYGMER